MSAFREHEGLGAPPGYGLRALVGASSVEIFLSDAFESGLPPIRLPAAEADELFRQVAEQPGCGLRIDLDAQTVTRRDGRAGALGVDAFRKCCFANGLDDIGLTAAPRGQDPRVGGAAQGRPTQALRAIGSANRGGRRPADIHEPGTRRAASVDAGHAELAAAWGSGEFLRAD